MPADRDFADELARVLFELQPGPLTTGRLTAAITHRIVVGKASRLGRQD